MQATKDRFGRRMRDLRISVTDRCNFRCSYCMPAEIFGESYKFLPKPDLLTFEEIERIARAAVACGVTKLRITGGEPLLRAHLPKLIEKLASIDGVTDLSLTTNAYLLAGHARTLKDAGLHRVTVSLDSLDEEVFREMNGRRSGLGPVFAGIEAAEREGLTPLKINCVVKKDVNDHTLVELAKRFRGTDSIVRFIEFMDVGNLNGWRLDDVVPKRDILERIGAEFPLIAVPPNYPGEVATRHRYADGQGEIGVIASVTEPFCGACTRARLSPEGKLVTCLFASDGHDLRAIVRSDASDEELTQALAKLWGARENRYSEKRTDDTPEKRKLEMYHLGG